jgi:hypothetical protein
LFLFNNLLKAIYRFAHAVLFLVVLTAEGAQTRGSACVSGEKKI